MSADEASTHDVNDALVTIAHAADLAEGQVLVGALAAAGIRAVLPEGHTTSLLWHLGTALGGLRVMVAASDEVDARALLDGYAGAAFEYPAGEGPETGTAAAPAGGEARADAPPALPPTPPELLARRALKAGVLVIFFPIMLVFLPLSFDEAWRRRDEMDARSRTILNRGLFAAGVALAVWLPYVLVFLFG